MDRVWEDKLLTTISKQRAAVRDIKLAAEAKQISWSSYWKALDTLEFLESLWDAMKHEDILFHKR